VNNKVLELHSIEWQRYLEFGNWFRVGNTSVINQPSENMQANSDICLVSRVRVVSELTLDGRLAELGPCTG
jgi:hypothetical protein